MTHDTDILIVGGGLNGPALALALAQGGLRVTVVDARPAPSESALMQMAMNDTPVQEYEDDFATSDVSDAELDETRGTFSPDMLNKNVLDAISNGNSSVNTVSGANTVSAEAFSNTSGLVNLIQNSGNNVIIQSSTIVNLTLQ